MLFEVGDRVIDPHFGEGTVVKSVVDVSLYPVEVSFDGNILHQKYTAEGYFCEDIKHQCLFHLEGYRPASCLEPKRSPFKCGDLVLVRNYQDEHWKCHIFQKYEEYIDNHYVCKNGFSYNFCIPYKGNEELLDTMNEPETRQGIP